MDNCRHSAHSAFSVWCGLSPRHQPRNRLLHSVPFTLKGLNSRQRGIRGGRKCCRASSGRETTTDSNWRRRTNRRHDSPGSSWSRLGHSGDLAGLIHFLLYNRHTNPGTTHRRSHACHTNPNRWAVFLQRGVSCWSCWLYSMRNSLTGYTQYRFHRKIVSSSLLDRHIPIVLQ